MNSEELSWLEAARWAPSAHNTQPWRFTSLCDGRIAVHWEPERTLAISDPTRRDLYLSLGAAIESAILGATDPPLAFLASEDERTVGYLQPVETQPGHDDRQLAASLSSRHTARVAHLPQAVPADVLQTLQEEARRSGCVLSVQSEPHAICRLARLARQATAAQFADPAIQEELWHWLRLDPRDPAYRRDGLNAECLNLRGFPLALARLTMVPARMKWLARLGLHHLLALDTEWTVRRSASLCLLTTPSLQRNAVLQTGRTLIRLWLQADQAGMSTHPISALIDCQQTVAPTLEAFGVHSVFPAAIFRLGATPPVARSYRLASPELIKGEEDQDSEQKREHKVKGR